MAVRISKRGSVAKAAKRAALYVRVSTDLQMVEDQVTRSS
jgi:hypothetical protein